MEHSEIAVLVKKAAAGDNDAFAKLYDISFDRFYYAALRTVRSREDAADIVQEAMVDIYKNLGKLKNAQAFVAYANRVVYGKSIDLLRTQNKWILADDLELPEFEETNDDFLPESYVETREKQQLVIDAIDSLSDNLRVIVLMYYYNQLTTPEIAGILELQESAVRTRLSRARALLKKKLENKEREEGLLFMPIFVLGKVLEADAGTLDTLAIKAKVWQSVSEAVGIAAPSAAAASSPAGAGTGAATAAKASLAIKIIAAIAVTAAAVTGLVSLLNNGAPNTPEDITTAPPEISSPVGSETPSPSDDIDNIIVPPVDETPGHRPDTENPAESAAPSGEPSGTAYFIIETAQLTYPLGTVLTDEIILRDTGARAQNTNSVLKVIALEDVDTGTKGEYYIYVRIPDTQISGLRQKVITITIT